MADRSTSLKLLVAAIKSRRPVSIHYDKAGKIPGLRIGNPHAAFILQRKDGTESTKIDIFQNACGSPTHPPPFPYLQLLLCQLPDPPFQELPPRLLLGPRQSFLIGSPSFSGPAEPAVHICTG